MELAMGRLHVSLHLDDASPRNETRRLDQPEGVERAFHQQQLWEQIETDRARQAAEHLLHDGWRI